MKYVDIYLDKKTKTQRIVIYNDMCSAELKKRLKYMNICFTTNYFVGAYNENEDYKSKTYKYAKNWNWLETIEL